MKRMNKTTVVFGIMFAGMTFLADSALAGGGQVPSVPDGGSAALLITISISALALGRKFFR